MELKKVDMVLNKVESSFRGSGYAWILCEYHDGRAFTVREAHEGMKAVGLVSDSKYGYRRASDCITRMQHTSEAHNGLKINYQNWLGCLKFFGKNNAGENLYCVTPRGRILGHKIALAEKAGINLRSHHLAKRVDKQFKVDIPKRGYFRTTKAYDPLLRTKAVQSNRRAGR